MCYVISSENTNKSLLFYLERDDDGLFEFCSCMDFMLKNYTILKSL